MKMFNPNSIYDCSWRNIRICSILREECFEVIACRRGGKSVAGTITHSRMKESFIISAVRNELYVC